MKNRLEIAVEWGDCDPAAILFYPNYFRWFDAGTRHLIEAAGLSYSRLRAEFDVIGLPLVNASSQFHRAARFGDRLVLESFVARWGGGSLTVRHRMLRGEDLCAEGEEARIWAVADAAAEAGFRVGTIPERVKEILPAIEA